MNDEELLKQREAEEIFKQSSASNARLHVMLPEVKSAKSFSEVEDDTGLESDLKTTLKRLFPKFPIRRLNSVASAIMVARVLPETMIPRINLTVMSIVEDWDNEVDGELFVMDIQNMVTTAFEIGLDSKGRVDAIEVHGSSQENENLERLASGMN